MTWKRSKGKIGSFDLVHRMSPIHPLLLAFNKFSQEVYYMNIYTNTKKCQQKSEQIYPTSINDAYLEDMHYSGSDPQIMHIMAQNREGVESMDHDLRAEGM